MRGANASLTPRVGPTDPALSATEVRTMDLEKQFLSNAAQAVRSQDSDALRKAIARSSSRTSVINTQRLFREELPLMLGPDDLLWLLQEMTDSKGFAEKRDQMIDALCSDLCKNGYVPGVDFSISPDARTGRAVHCSASVWNSVCENLSQRAVQHYRVFVCIGD